MSIVIADRVMETTVTTGTGTVNLAGAVTGFRGFVAGAGDGAVVYYAIVGRDGGGAEGEWENGIGTVTDAAPDTLSRTTILSSSNAGSAVDFSAGTKDVFLSLPAHSVGFMGALVYLTGDKTITTGAGWSFLSFAAETYDVGGWHDNSTNPTRLTVPSGVDRVRIGFQVQWTADNTGNRLNTIYKNNAAGTAVNGFPSAIAVALNLSPCYLAVASAVVPVVAGDYFEVAAWHNKGTDLDVLAANTGFWIEKVGP